MDSIGDNLTANADYALLFVYYINLESVSFLEEFNFGFVKSENLYNSRIKEIRKITSPILKRINKWTDLEKFRNSIIAHPWRDKKGNFVVPNQGYYNVPRNWFDVAVLLNLMTYVWSLIKEEFKEELNEALLYVSTLQTSPKAPNDYSNLNSDHSEMVNDVNEQCKHLNKKYYLKVLLYDLPNEGEK